MPTLEMVWETALPTPISSWKCAPQAWPWANLMKVSSFQALLGLCPADR